MISLLFIKKLLIYSGLIGGAIAVPLTIDNLKGNPYDTGEWNRDIYEEKTGEEYNEELKRKCDDKARITVPASDGKSVTVNTDGLLQLLKNRDDDKIPLPKHLELPEGC